MVFKQMMKVYTAEFGCIVIGEVFKFIIHERYRARCDVKLASVVYYRRSEDHHRYERLLLRGSVSSYRFVHQSFGNLVQLLFKSIGTIAFIGKTCIFKSREAYKQVISQQTEY